MNITLDIILLAVLVISFVIGYKKGFVKSVWKIVALVVTIVLVLALKTPTVNFLAGSALANNISTKIAENVNIALVSMFAPAESNLYEMIDKTYAVKYLYNYNILLQLFMKI